MAKYATVDDILDEAITVQEEELLQADRLIDNYLRKIGVDPDKIKSRDILKDIAVKYACYVASTREAMGDNTLYIEKAKQYEKQYKDLLNSLSVSSFPEIKTPNPVGAIRIGRG